MGAAAALYCPYCGTKLPELQTYSTKALQTCPHCKLEYYHKDIREPAFYDRPKYPKAAITLLLDLNYGVYSILVCHGMAAVLLWKDGIRGIILSAILLGFCWLRKWLPMLILFVPLHRGYFREKREYKASVARLADKAYIIRLLDYGYKIHRFYLPARYPDLVDYKPPVKPKTKDGTIFYF